MAGKIYLEVGSATHKNELGRVLFVSHCSNIDTKKRISFDFQETRKLPYFKKFITKFVNDNFNTNFDSIEVLDDLSGYRVLKTMGGYNLISDFKYNKELTAKRLEIKKHFYNLEKMSYWKIGKTRLKNSFICLVMLEGLIFHYGIIRKMTTKTGCIY